MDWVDLAVYFAGLVALLIAALTLFYRFGRWTERLDGLKLTMDGMVKRMDTMDDTIKEIRTDIRKIYERLP